MKTIDEWRDEADQLIRDHHAWRKHRSGDVEKLLNKPNGAPISRLELGIIAERADLYGRHARVLLQHPSASLSRNADHRDDLTEIAEESELGAAEAGDAADPETVFREADPQTKAALTQRMPIHPDKADRIRARLRGDMRDRSGIGSPSVASKSK